MDFEQARLNMIEQQIRPWEVLDQVTLDLINEVHREDFVPEEFKQLALADMPIPLANGQVTMTPKLEARIIQSLNITVTDKILEIGTGCGYMTALLAKSGAYIHSIDIFPDFIQEAAAKLSAYEIDNVNLDHRDGIHGLESESPFDVIVVTGSVEELTADFQHQLAYNGRLFVIVGRSPVMEANLLTRIGENEWAREVLFETDVPPLIGAVKQDIFKF